MDSSLKLVADAAAGIVRALDTSGPGNANI